jgi:hypothetical protein
MRRLLPGAFSVETNALARLPLGDVLGLAELVDDEVAGPLFYDLLDLGALVSRKDHETVGL